MTKQLAGQWDVVLDNVDLPIVGCFCLSTPLPTHKAANNKPLMNEDVISYHEPTQIIQGLAWLSVSSCQVVTKILPHVKS